VIVLVEKEAAKYLERLNEPNQCRIKTALVMLHSYRLRDGYFTHRTTGRSPAGMGARFPRPPCKGGRVLRMGLHRLRFGPPVCGCDVAVCGSSLFITGESAAGGRAVFAGKSFIMEYRGGFIAYVSRGAEYAVLDGKPKSRAGKVRPVAVDYRVGCAALGGLITISSPRCYHSRGRGK
jgi:hypothetical protein